MRELCLVCAALCAVLGLALDNVPLLLLGFIPAYAVHIHTPWEID